MTGDPSVVSMSIVSATGGSITMDRAVEKVCAGQMERGNNIIDGRFHP